MYHNSYGPSPPAKDGSDPNSAVRLASNINSLVTPTPKKPKFTEIAPRQHPAPPSTQCHGAGSHHHHHQVVHVPPGHQVQVVRRHSMSTTIMHPSHQPTVYTAVPMQQQQHPVHPPKLLQQQQLHQVEPASSSSSVMRLPESQKQHQPPLMEPSMPCPSAAEYSRKKKSLGVLAQNFLERYQDCTTGTEVVVDEAAADLGVERRRICE
jgi:E2F/DP family winged-helix DNA-binding domain